MRPICRIPTAPSQICYCEELLFWMIYLCYHSDCVAQIRARLSVRWKQKQACGFRWICETEKTAKRARHGDNLGKEKSAKASILCFIATTAPHVRVHASSCHVDTSDRSLRSRLSSDDKIKSLIIEQFASCLDNAHISHRKSLRLRQDLNN